jgi:hypothetical protein
MLKKYWWLILAAVAAYMFRDKIKGLFSKDTNVEGSEKSVSVDGIDDLENLA